MQLDKTLIFYVQYINDGDLKQDILISTNLATTGQDIFFACGLLLLIPQSAL